MTHTLSRRVSLNWSYVIVSLSATEDSESQQVGDPAAVDQ